MSQISWIPDKKLIRTSTDPLVLLEGHSAHLELQVCNEKKAGKGRSGIRLDRLCRLLANSSHQPHQDWT
jgi:hypothetical protein